MDSPQPTVSVILVTYNSNATLPGVLESLQQSDIADNLELVVVDNNSTDTSLQTVQSIFPDAKIIHNRSNTGFASACNQGAEISRGEFLLFYNPDLKVDRTAISILVKTAREHSDAGAISGRMRYPDGSFQPTCREFPTYGNIFYSRGSFLTKIGFTGKPYTLPDYETTTEVPAVAGTFLLIRKKLFDTVGRFDERFFVFMEDTDLSYRLVKSGYKNYYVPAAGGVHQWGEGSSAGKARRLYYHHRSVWKYFIKYFPNPFTLLILPLLLAGNLILGLLLPKR